MMNDVPTVAIKDAMSFSYSNFNTNLTLPYCLTEGQDLSYCFKNKSEGSRYFFIKYIKCLFEKEKISTLKIIISQEHFDTLCLSTSIPKGCDIEKIDGIYHILISQEFEDFAKRKLGLDW